MNASAAPCPEFSTFGGRPRHSVLERIAAALTRAALWPARVMEARRTFAQLASLSEYELRDVGLTRQDLVDLTARPLDEDPTPHLNRARISRAQRAS
ncbi:MAG TPA: DUF1127 domain-containing protein [Roseiarcus sp.]|nr:DUF1127 domain-containing protein [Roseiarcus sp.]